MNLHEDMRKIWKQLTKAGLTQEGAAGLMGNLYAESGCIPNRVEILCLKRLAELGKYYTDATYTAFVDDGTISRASFLNPLPGKQYGYGLAQWTSPGRKGKLYDHCKAQKVSIGNLAAQLDFLVSELQTSYQSVWKVLTSTDSIREASDYVLTKFEMPSDTSEAVKQARAGYGQGIYDQLAERAGVTAEAVLDVMRGWIGYSESDGRHKRIVDIYNQYGAVHGYPRGYKVTYSDAWCDATVSAAFIKLDSVNLIGGVECGVEEHIQIFKRAGIWIEDGTIVPKPGDIVCYNWDLMTQPNDGPADHIGIVEDVYGGRITVIEGNFGNRVQRRSIPIGWEYIRGYARPKYAAAESPKETPKESNYMFTPKTVMNGSSGTSVALLQTLLRGLGYLGANMKQLTIDGQAGANTIYALKRYQGDYGLDADGVAGPLTWTMIIGI